MDVDVDYVHNGGYWDGPLSGTLRARGHYYHFDLAREEYWRSDDPDECGSERFYNVYRLRREIMAKIITNTRRWCHNVGWHQAYRPGENRRLRHPKPGWSEWLEKNPTRDEDRIGKEAMMDGAELVGAVVWPLKRIVSKSIEELIDEWRAGVLSEHPAAVFHP